MKKFLTILALALATATAAHAQFGIIGGYTASTTNLDKNLIDVKAMSQWHAGFVYKIGLGPFFALQPSLTYEAKGVKVQEAQKDVSTLENTSGFVELGLGAQVGVDLLAFRPFVMAEPFVGYQVYQNGNYTGAGAGSESVSQTLKNAQNKVEYGFGVGGGLEILHHFQVSVQWFQNLGHLFNEDKIANVPGAVSSSYNDIKNYQGIKLSLAVLF